MLAARKVFVGTLLAYARAASILDYMLTATTPRNDHRSRGRIENNVSHEASCLVRCSYIVLMMLSATSARLIHVHVQSHSFTYYRPTINLLRSESQGETGDNLCKSVRKGKAIDRHSNAIIRYLPLYMRMCVGNFICTSTMRLSSDHNFEQIN